MKAINRKRGFDVVIKIRDEENKEVFLSSTDYNFCLNENSNLIVTKNDDPGFSFHVSKRRFYKAFIFTVPNRKLIMHSLFLTKEFSYNQLKKLIFKAGFNINNKPPKAATSGGL